MSRCQRDKDPAHQRTEKLRRATTAAAPDLSARLMRVHYRVSSIDLSLGVEKATQRKPASNGDDLIRRTSRKVSEVSSEMQVPAFLTGLISHWCVRSQPMGQDETSQALF